jgi:hypothetical protein
MDDMLLSAVERRVLEQAIETIVEAANKSGFAMNTSKTVGPADAVEVFNLQLTNGSLSVVEQRMKLFEEVVLCSERSVVDSVIGYVQTVNKDQASRLRLVSVGATGLPT